MYNNGETMKELSHFKSADNKDIPFIQFNPQNEVKGAIVLIYEIFGITEHIESVATNFAEIGYKVIVPDIFARIKKNVNLPYDNTGIAEGKKLKEELGWELPVMDIVACASNLKINHNVGIIGYCYGGSLTWRSVQKGFLFSCAVSYYGSNIVNFLDIPTKCPTQIHLGSMDKSIPQKDIDKITKFNSTTNSENEIFLYDSADHGFNCDHRSSYNSNAATKALDRSVSFFEKHLSE